MTQYEPLPFSQPYVVIIATGHVRGMAVVNLNHFYRTLIKTHETSHRNKSLWDSMNVFG